MTMVNFVKSCDPPRTNVEKPWDYYEYYVGERDQEERKNGDGRNHWSGAESLEWYTGRLLRDTMHGVGEYRSRHRGPDNMAVTYEGYFYNNCLHGHGTMSYPDGRVFTGIYHTNIRWGPGVERHACLKANVGLWNGTQLVRLSWRPATHNVTPDLMATPIGRSIVAKHRAVLANRTKIVGEVNSAIELLKQCGAHPLVAAQKWTQLYPKTCTDKNSQLYHEDVFERAYYDNQIEMLELLTTRPEPSVNGSHSNTSESEKVYYAWNNNEMMMHMMKHCYQHEQQKKQSEISITEILNGPRTFFKPAAQHELDCRSLLMASFLGNIQKVAQLINEYDVSPNVTDIQGSSAVMYAACGGQHEIIHFLIEAGARIDDLNDACCTPLGAALIGYACARWEIPPSKVTQAIIPVGVVAPTEDIFSEWKIERDLMQNTGMVKIPSKLLKTPPGTLKKTKSMMSATTLKQGKKSEMIGHKDHDAVKNANSAHRDSTFELSNEERLYSILNNEYINKVNELFLIPSLINPVPYIFEVNNMITEIDLATEDEQKKVPDKKDVKKAVSKVMKDSLKPSREVLMAMSRTLNQSPSMDIKEKIKAERLEQLMSTIKQLLSDGADPRKVCCPQSALLTAIACYSSDLIRELIEHGADINETYPQIFGYSPLDVAISGSFTNENLDCIRALLTGGANVDHRLLMDPDSLKPDDETELGPTLLHAVLAKKTEEVEALEENRHQILELLLERGCDPTARYKGRAAVDIAMSKHLDIFEIFIESPNTDLNAIINDMNQTILVKMFYLPYCRNITVAERLHTLSNLLLFGADPLLTCQNGDEYYENIFVYAKKTLSEISTKPVVNTTVSKDSKKGKPEVKPPDKSKAKGVSATSSRSIAGTGDELGDFKESLCLVTNCARLLYIRWIQAKLMKDLIVVVDKYKHRHWNMILKEQKNSKCIGLWLNPVRCLEIWDVLKTTKKKIYNDKRVLHHLLCVVNHAFQKRKKILRSDTMTSQEKTRIETEVAYFVREHKSANIVQAWKRPYVTPELTPASEIEKFNVCFECAIPLEEAKIPCGLCKLVNFCSFECMKENIERYNCHPCSFYLKKKYFPTPPSSENGTMTYAASV
ncbi:ankyrin repeat and MYND domain-containing protein 1-like [Anticarsia gemmatalis]|uniref:ankyrin repeat and MYND domain-containing protein 1-like n=1 Tax=Anticarsia gemmatalis TaxID=129554 RepID=UPI003F76E43F